MPYKCSLNFGYLSRLIDVIITFEFDKVLICDISKISSVELGFRLQQIFRDNRYDKRIELRQKR